MKFQRTLAQASAESPADRKKRIETQYIEEARRASSKFPVGELVPHERPDFLLRRGPTTIGVEVTELCRKEERAEGGRLAKVADAAQQRFARLSTADPIDVNASFAPDTETVPLPELITGLANFVNANLGKGNSFDWNDCELPPGYCHIAIHSALGPVGHWRTAKVFSCELVLRELLVERIAEKNLRLADYRQSADEVWLLIVNDQFLGAGEVYARPDHRWTFSFDFDKVLVFVREPGGSGEVTELRRG